MSAFGICAFFYMWNLFGVVVFQRSMLDWRRGYILYQCAIHLKSWSNCALHLKTWPNLDLGHQIPLPWGYILSRCALHLKTWPIYALHLKTWHNSDLGHQMPLPGGTSDLRVPFIWKYELTSKFTLASQRSFLQKTNEPTKSIHIY